jgi:hypothetical protein
MSGRFLEEGIAHIHNSAQEGKGASLALEIFRANLGRALWEAVVFRNGDESQPLALGFRLGFAENDG